MNQWPQPSQPAASQSSGWEQPRPPVPEAPDGQQFLSDVHAMHLGLFQSFANRWPAFSEENADTFGAVIEYTKALQEAAWDLTQAKLKESYRNGKRMTRQTRREP